MGDRRWGVGNGGIGDEGWGWGVLGEEWGVTNGG